MRMLVRLAIWGLAAYGAKRLYDTYFGYADQAKKAGSAIVDRVGRASGRVKEETHDAVGLMLRAVLENLSNYLMGQTYPCLTQCFVAGVAGSAARNGS